MSFGAAAIGGGKPKESARDVRFSVGTFCRRGPDRAEIDISRTADGCFSFISTNWDAWARSSFRSRSPPFCCSFFDRVAAELVFRNGGDLDGEEGDIVLRLLATMPEGDFLQQGVDPMSERFGPCSAESLQKPGVSEAFAGGVHGIGEAVGVKIQPVPRRELDAILDVRLFGEADRKTGAVEENRRSADGKV